MAGFSAVEPRYQNVKGARTRNPRPTGEQRQPQRSDVVTPTTGALLRPGHAQTAQQRVGPPTTMTGRSIAPAQRARLRREPARNQVVATLTPLWDQRDAPKRPSNTLVNRRLTTAPPGEHHPKRKWCLRQRVLSANPETPTQAQNDRANEAVRRAHRCD